MPEPEVLPPEETSLSLRSLSPQHKKLVRVLGTGAIISGMLWCINEFTSIRGVNSVLASRIILVILWFLILLLGIVVLWGISLRKRRLLIIPWVIISAAILFAADYWSPRPSLTQLTVSNSGAGQKSPSNGSWLAALKHEPSMQDIFQNDYSNTMKLTDDAIGFKWKDTGTITRIKRQLYLDFPANSKFVGFYVPISNPLDPTRTVEICMKLAKVDAVHGVLNDLPKQTSIAAGLGQTTTIEDLRFSGRVLIYHDDLLSITQQSDIIRAFKNKQYSVQFFGPSDFGKTLSSWHQLHDSKAASQ